MGKFEDMIKEAYGSLGENTEETAGDGELGTKENKKLRAAADTDDEAKKIVDKLDQDAEDIKSDAETELKKK